MKSLGIMQPYFLPYIGYWQLISAVDEFVVYDNIEYTKKGWFNRNRILGTGTDRLFTIPIKKDADYLDVNKRFLSDISESENSRTLRVIQATYKKAPQFADVYPFIESCFLYEDKNLFEYILNSIKLVCEYLGIDTKIVVSSQVPINHSLKGAEKVVAICKALNTTTYINAIGGIELYDKERFKANGLELKFIKPQSVEYQQFGMQFVAGLSIIDVLMFNDKQTVKIMLEGYELV